MILTALGAYVIIGLLVSLRSDYVHGDREHAVDTMLDIALWPIMVMFWIRHWGR